MITFAEWVEQQNEGWGGIKRVAKNIVSAIPAAATDLAFGPDTGVDTPTAMGAIKGAATAVNQFVNREPINKRRRIGGGRISSSPLFPNR